MEILTGFLLITQSVSISLGVGCSTLAILNFFAAIKDGLIDESERNLMGIVYVVLRIAMVLILLTTVLLALPAYLEAGNAYFTPLALSIWTLILVLYLNAFLMTKHIMPSTFGPAIQAGTWYTLGIVGSLITIRQDDFTYLQFLLGYVAAVTLAVAVVNGVMAYMKSKREEKKTTD